ncbi:MAG: HAMP domain-containing histidine kinase [Flavobacterium sp.]|nr:HAMP domain-containing histidine kinase [Flavobacterium sp.]
MKQFKIIDKLKSPNGFTLLLIIFLACGLLIFINFFTIKILSTNRAYLNGESHYSKGQKDATRQLITYLYTQNKKQWLAFKEELKTPKGDGIARVNLTNNGDIALIKKGLRAGGNNEKDLDGMIWQFKNFHHIPFFAKAIKEWEIGDHLIVQLETLGNEVHEQVITKGLDSEAKKSFLSRISTLSDKLSVAERNYSNSLSDGTRKIESYLIYTNVFFILIIIGSVTFYYSMMLRKIEVSKLEIELQNRNLVLANQELDKFVYSASHDLRSPITSLKGLIEIAEIEDDLTQIKEYLALMHQSLTLQDKFISDIIDYSRNKRKDVILEPVSLSKLIDESLEQHQYMNESRNIVIQKNISADFIQSDSLRLKIILNNLVSNAMKYADSNKQEPYIAISTSKNENNCTIEIKDNGIGIKEEYLDRIFEMFFVTNSNTGSGLGLYIVKEAVQNLNGTIAAQSKINQGTIFTVTIPNSYAN